MPDLTTIPPIRLSVDDILFHSGEDAPVTKKESVAGPDNPLNPNGSDESFLVLYDDSRENIAILRVRTGQILDISRADGDDVLTFPEFVPYQTGSIAVPSPHSVSAFQAVTIGEPMSTDLLGQQHQTLTFAFIPQAITVNPDDEPRERISGYIPDDHGGRWKDAEIFVDKNKTVTDIRIY
jgi:hypothetical protein